MELCRSGIGAGVAAALAVIVTVESEEEVENASTDVDELDRSPGEAERFRGGAGPEACEV